LLGALFAVAALSLKVMPETAHNAELQTSLARVLELMSTTVLVGRDAETTCSASCTRVQVQLSGKVAVLTARRGADTSRATLELPGAGYGFDQVHALALQIRGLVEGLPPVGLHPPVYPPAIDPARPQAEPPRLAPEPQIPPPAAPVAAPSEPPQSTVVQPPPAPPPVPLPRLESRFAVGAGFVALFSRDPDFRTQGLLLTTRFPLFGPIDGRLSVGLLPSRLRVGDTGRYAVHVLPFDLSFSAPLFIRQLRLGLGVQVVDASVEYATAELDTAQAWTVGPTAQLGARLGVGSALTVHLGLGVVWHPFRQQVATGSGVIFAYPVWSFLASATAEVNLHR
jgi:hypothetical protein